MKRINRNIILTLVGITIVAIILRFWDLGSVPPSLDWDEASWGYNAYSVIQTGRDEYGKLLPVVVRSLNDYKPALYMYLIIPFVWAMGLTDTAVRSANAIFGVLTVITTYFLAYELFKRRSIALISSFLMAISPWSIQFSRFAHEGIVGLEFNLLMALFFIKGLSKPKYLILSAIFAALSLYSYQGEKIFVPLFGLILIAAFFKEFIKVPKKYLVYAIITGAIICLPLIAFTLTTPESFSRAKGASFLNKPTGVVTENHTRRLLVDHQNKDYIGLVFDNRRIIYGKEILGNYLSHFDPNFLFVKGELIPRHQATGMGHLYLIELPFLLFGLYFLFFGHFRRGAKVFVVLWMLIVPIGASITWDVPNSGRTINFLPTFQMITAIGIVYFYAFIKQRKFNNFIKYLIFGVLICAALFNFIYYINQYFVQYKYFESEAWQYGYNEVIPVINKVYVDYDQIIVSDYPPLDQSYIFFLYNLKYSPERYQKESAGNTTVRKFDKYVFRQIKSNEWQNSDSRTLFIGNPNDFPAEADGNIIKTIYFKDGEVMSKIVKGKAK
jgi:4-amino-4-deoxy-L-arabinose transferase-like glycosyltransferase